MMKYLTRVTRLDHGGCYNIGHRSSMKYENNLVEITRNVHGNVVAAVERELSFAVQQIVVEPCCFMR